MPFDPISYMLAKKKLNKKDYKLSTLPIDTDLDMGGFKITDLGEPVNPNDAPTRRYVDVATTGLGINYYFLDAADAEVPAYKQLSITPPELAEAYVETAQNSAGDYEIGSWIAPADSIPTLRLGVYTINFQAERIGGNIDVRFFFRLYERDTLGTETLIAESSLSDIVTDRRDVVTSLILASDHVMAAGSRLVLKIYVRFLSSGASTTVRLYYQGAVRSRLATPIAKEVLDTLYLSVNGGTFSGDYLPDADNTRSIGTNALRLANVYAVNVYTGDLCFEEKVCDVCGRPFEEGDEIVLKVKKVDDYTRTVPIHVKCSQAYKELDERLKKIEGVM